MIRPNSRFAIDRLKSSALRPADLERPADLGAERPEQRGRASTGGRDRDALGDRLGVLPTASRLVRTSAPSSVTSPDISAMPCALSLIGPKVSIATMTPTGGEQAGAGQRDGEQRDDRRAAAEQERRVDRATDEQRGVDRPTRADRDAGQDDRGRAGERALADLLDRLAVGLGEVAGAAPGSGWPARCR
jgi:hypothetical protein